MGEGSVIHGKSPGSRAARLPWKFAGSSGAIAEWLVHCADPLGSNLRPPQAQLSNRQVRTLLAKADAHKVLPSVLRHYPFAAGDAPLDRIRQDADSRRLERAALSTMLKHHAGLILEAARDLPVELVKGPAFAGLYPPGLRPYGDIDVLTAPSALPQLGDTLADLGFVRLRDTRHDALEYAWVRRDNRLLMVEVHTNLVHLPRMREAFSLTYQDLAGNFQRPGALLAVAVVHGGMHYFAWLRHVVDICQAARAIETSEDETLFEELAGRSGTRMIAIVGLHLAYRLFGERRCLDIAQSLGAPRDYRFARTLLEGAVLTASSNGRLIYNGWRRIVFRELMRNGTLAAGVGVRAPVPKMSSTFSVDTSSPMPPLDTSALAAPHYKVVGTKGGPPVSCMCLTYGRPHVLEEAIGSFLLQDYEGEKELIVLNDLPDQELAFDHPEVKIINVKKRFRGMGEKRNACAALCSHDLLFVWDDDDICLPWRLSFCAQKLGEGRRFFKPARSFFLSKGEISGPEPNVFHASACWQRSLYDEVGGYPHTQGAGEDIAIEAKFVEALKGVPLSDVLPVEANFYIYRWIGTNSYHLSAFGDPSDYRMVADYVSQQQVSGDIATGRVLLKPHWKIDYGAAVAAHIEHSSLTSEIEKAPTGTPREKRR